MSSIPAGLVWHTNMAAFSFSWNANMADGTLCENALYINKKWGKENGVKVYPNFVLAP